jgi:hypothetical protein
MSRVQNPPFWLVISGLYYPLYIGMIRIIIHHGVRNQFFTNIQYRMYLSMDWFEEKL